MSFMSQESGMSLSIPQKFRQSAQELKNVHTLTGVSVLLAMSVVISFMASVRITESIKIGLGYLERGRSSSICSSRMEPISSALPSPPCWAA